VSFNYQLKVNFVGKLPHSSQFQKHATSTKLSHYLRHAQDKDPTESATSTNKNGLAQVLTHEKSYDPGRGGGGGSDQRPVYSSQKYILLKCSSIKTYTEQSEGHVFDRAHMFSPYGQSGHVKVKDKDVLASK